MIFGLLPGKGNLRGGTAAWACRHQSFLILLFRNMKKPLTMAQLLLLGRQPLNATVPPTDTGQMFTATSLLTSQASASEKALQWCLQHSPPRPTGLNSGRNSWLARLAFFCNEKGVPEALLCHHALTHWLGPDFDDTEVRRLIERIYHRKAAEYNTKPFVPAKDYRTQISTSTPTTLMTSVAAGDEPPAFPPTVYATLPEFLRHSCRTFEGREADVLLTSLLTLLSGAFPTVSGTYDGKLTGLNLYALIAAPAASGKGTMAWAQHVVRVRHRQLEQANQQARREYQMELTQYQASKRSTKGGAGSPPEEPVSKRLLLPADASFAALVQALVENDGQGIFCEPEADTLSAILKNQDWGSWGPLLRNAFHHEPYATLRKGTGQLEVARPALSVLLTGTPHQVQRLLPDVENGLYSRFLFYTFTSEPYWRDTFAAREPLDKYYEQLGQELAAMIIAVTAPVNIELTAEQQARHRAAFAAWTDDINNAYPAQHSTLRRLGLCAFRLAMLLTLLRTFEDGVQPAGTLVCSDQDFDTAMSLITVFRAHTNHLLQTLSPEKPADGLAGEQASLKTRARELQAAGQSIRQIATQLGISKTVVGRWLRDPDRLADNLGPLGIAA